MDDSAKYIYCIIGCSASRGFDCTAIGATANPVYTVCHRSIAAVVSDSNVNRYDNNRKNMIAHEKVQEGVMHEFTVLPVRFGTVSDSSTPVRELQKLLSYRYDEFTDLLDKMDGKVELGVKAFWRDAPAIFSEIMEGDPYLRRMRDSLAGKPPEATHFDRIRLGEMIKEALEKKRGKEAAKMIAVLSDLAVDTRENDTLSDKMVMNAAFLVDKKKEHEFDRAISQLDEQLGHRLLFKYVGHDTPPYNFVNLVINWNEIREGEASVRR